MPYGIPKEYGGDSQKNVKWMEKCVASVMDTGKNKQSAIKICKAKFIKERKKNK
jgi:hypothetical protein